MLVDYRLKVVRARAQLDTSPISDTGTAIRKAAEKSGYR
jgi:hypothetical protein